MLQSKNQMELLQIKVSKLQGQLGITQDESMYTTKVVNTAEKLLKYIEKLEQILDIKQQNQKNSVQLKEIMTRINEVLITGKGKRLQMVLDLFQIKRILVSDIQNLMKLRQLLRYPCDFNLDASEALRQYNEITIFDFEQLAKVLIAIEYYKFVPIDAVQKELEKHFQQIDLSANFFLSDDPFVQKIWKHLDDYHNMKTEKRVVINFDYQYFAKEMRNERSQLETYLMQSHTAVQNNQKLCIVPTSPSKLPDSYQTLREEQKPTPISELKQLPSLEQLERERKMNAIIDIQEEMKLPKVEKLLTLSLNSVQVEIYLQRIRMVQQLQQQFFQLLEDQKRCYSLAIEVRDDFQRVFRMLVQNVHNMMNVVSQFQWTTGLLTNCLFQVDLISHKIVNTIDDTILYKLLCSLNYSHNDSIQILAILNTGYNKAKLILNCVIDVADKRLCQIQNWLHQGSRNQCQLQQLFNVIVNEAQNIHLMVEYNNQSDVHLLRIPIKECQLERMNTPYKDQLEQIFEESELENPRTSKFSADIYPIIELDEFFNEQKQQDILKKEITAIQQKLNFSQAEKDFSSNITIEQQKNYLKLLQDVLEAVSSINAKQTQFESLFQSGSIKEIASFVIQLMLNYQEFQMLIRRPLNTAFKQDNVFQKFLMKLKQHELFQNIVAEKSNEQIIQQLFATAENNNESQLQKIQQLIEGEDGRLADERKNAYQAKQSNYQLLSVPIGDISSYCIPQDAQKQLQIQQRNAQKIQQSTKPTTYQKVLNKPQTTQNCQQNEIVKSKQFEDKSAVYVVSKQDKLQFSEVNYQEIVQLSGAEEVCGYEGEK